MPMRTFAAAVLLASGFAGIVAADFAVTSLATEIFYRTAKLYSAGGQLAGGGESVSTVTAVVVESQADIGGSTR
jgi:C4-dicarboxylate transporter